MNLSGFIYLAPVMGIIGFVFALAVYSSIRATPVSDPEISRIADELVFIDNGKIWYRTAKEDLIEKWRKVSFRLDRNEVVIKAALGHKREGDSHQVVSSDYAATIQHLQELVAENIQESPMSIEEIAVQILKGGKNVETI